MKRLICLGACLMLADVSAPLVSADESARTNAVAGLPASGTTTGALPAEAGPKPVVLAPATRGLLKEARQALATNDYETAAARYDAVLAQNPQSLIALTNLGVVRYQQGKLEAAEVVLRKAVVVAPGDSGAWSLLGATHFRQGKLDVALEELSRAVALDSTNAEAHNFLGIVLSEKGKPVDAEQEVRRALELKSDYADAQINLAVLYAHQQPPRRELARFHYRKALALGAPPDAGLEALLRPGATTTNAPAPR